MKDYFAERAQCPQCLETGFMVISVGEHQVLICCQCSFGKEAHDQHHVEQWSFEEHKSFRTEPLSATWFHPQPGEDKVWQWKKMIDYAKQFWGEQQ